MMLHVLVAVDNGTQKECVVTDDDLLAHALFKLLQEIYGGANVAHWHRTLNCVPFVLAGALAARAYGRVAYCVDASQEHEPEEWRGTE